MWTEYTAKDVARFWSKADCSAGMFECWIWTAHKDRYGTIRWGSGKMQKAHRVSYLLAHGDPGDLEVLHKCDNPACVNPVHLFLGTQIDNIHDMIAKGRDIQPRGEQHGECKYTDEQVAEMRCAYAKGYMTLKQIGAPYGAPKSTVWGIVRGRARSSRG